MVDCLTTLDVGELGCQDEEQLTFAVHESRVLITHNRTDFENLAVEWWNRHQDHAGMLLSIRRKDTYDLLRHVLAVLQLYDQAGWRNTVLYA